MKNKVNALGIYAIEDQRIIKRIQRHFSVLSRRENIDVRFDGAINGEARWDNELVQTLSAADLIFVFLSADLLASDYFYEELIPQIWAQRENKKSHVLPVLLSHCDWKKTPFNRVQALPRKSRPVDIWENEDEVLFHLKNTVERVLDNLLMKR